MCKKYFLNKEQEKEVLEFMKRNEITKKTFAKIASTPYNNIHYAFANNRVKTSWVELAQLKNWRVKDIPLDLS